MPDAELLLESHGDTAPARPLARPNELAVSLAAIRGNVAALRAATRPGVRVFAALKADAYGFGLLPVGRAVAQAGVDGIGVSDLEDAVALRRDGFAGTLLLYAGPLLSPALVEAIDAFDIVPTVTGPPDAEAIAASAPCRAVAVKIDVGLTRLGAPAGPVARRTIAHTRALGLRVRIVYTHMHGTSAGDAAAHAAWQFERFRASTAAADGAMRMAASSFALQMTGDMDLDAVDPGHLLFGVHPPGPVSGRLALRPALIKLASRLIQVRDVTRDEHGPHAPFDPAGVERLGVLPIGRADGAHLVHAGAVLVRGRRARVLGEIAAEYTRLDLTGIDATAGDEAVLVGAQGAEAIGIAEIVAARALRGAGDLAMSVSPRVPRTYPHEESSA